MILEARDLFFSYASYTSCENPMVLKGVDLSLNKGDKVLILGEPGSGKTTLSLLLSSLVPQYMDGKMEGTVFPSSELSSRMDRYSLVPQNSDAYMLFSSVTDELAFPLESLGLEREEMVERVERSVRRWGLEHLLRTPLAAQSGGEKKRVMIAAALVTEPECIILDEAFDDLDPYWRLKLALFIRRTDAAVLATASRHSDIFDTVFDTILLLKDGILIPWDGSKEEIRRPSLPPPGEKHILSVENAVYSRPDGFSLSIPSFTVESGKITVLMGENGSGKSTFARFLSGLIEGSGSVLMDGKALTEKERRGTVGLMFQNPDRSQFLPSVRDELMYSLSFLPLKKKEREKRAEDMERAFGLSPDDIPSLMSYGRRKRLQGAVTALLGRPFIVLDELDSALSYSDAEEILSLLMEDGAGIVLITHDGAFASALADRSYRVEGGVIHEE